MTNDGRGISPQQAQEIRAQKGLEETKLQKIRVERNLSQKQLSVISGVSMRAIQCYEQQTRAIENAKLETLINLSVALGCKIGDILEDEKIADRYKVVR